MWCSHAAAHLLLYQMWEEVLPSFGRRGDPGLVGTLAAGSPGAVRRLLAVRGVADIRHGAHPVCERRPAPREAGAAALGEGPCLPGLPAVNFPAVPAPKVGLYIRRVIQMPQNFCFWNPALSSQAGPNVWPAAYAHRGCIHDEQDTGVV